MVINLSSMLPPSVPDVCLEQGFAWLEKNQKRFYPLANYAQFRKDATLIKEAFRQICHSSMAFPSREIEAVAIGSSQYKEIDKTLRLRFFDWFVNRSWASKFIQAPSAEFACDFGFVLSAHLPSNLMMNIIVMSRNPSEHPNYVERFFHYVDNIDGISEDLAYLCAFAFTGATSGYGEINTNHNAVAPVHLDYFKNFLKREAQNLNPSYHSSQRYSGVTRIWGDAAMFASDQLVTNIRLELKASITTSEVVVPNPFAPVAAKRTYGETIDEQALQKELIPAIIEATKGFVPTTDANNEEGLNYAAA